MSKSVLIVDDELLVRRALSRLFSNDGFKVFEAANGAEGLELFLTANPDYVFLDIMMPVMTGPEFVQSLKQKGYPLSNVIIMSAIKDTQQLPFMKEVRSFVTKPFENLFALRNILHELH